ncbi:MAG: FHA domain-containing protein [Actinomycetota bacterium]|nr:FHA domain-containing protein [Actinomycetota bacterium]
MRCPQCQAELPVDASFCPNCGLEVEHEPTITYVPLQTEPPHASLPTEQAAHLDVEGFALVLAKGPRSGITWVLPAGLTTVGRHPDNDIFLDDITVSRHHCRFVSGPDGLEVEDSGSTNGTYVNGDRADRARLSPGDEVIIGKFHLIVARGDA